MVSLHQLLPDEAQRAMAQRSFAARADKMAAIGLQAKLCGTSLEPYGVPEELSALPQEEFMALIREMTTAHAIGKMDEALKLKPKVGRCRALSSLLPQEGDESPIARADRPPVLHVVVARYREDVAWLRQLPPQISYHVMQKDALSPELPEAAQTLEPNVGRESHSYLRHMQRLLSAHHEGGTPLPPLVVCCQADPFDHNPSIVDDLATLARCAATDRMPKWTPLGQWTDGERLLHCDASGAPHAQRLLPIGRVWRALFTDARHVPLWLAFTPGACFAVSGKVLLRPGLPALLETALSPACGVSAAVDPIAGHVFERLWMYILLDDAEVDEAVRVFGGGADG